MSTFDTKRDVRMASFQHSNAGNAEELFEIQRKEMIDFLKRELQCTIGSEPVPMTMPILIDKFREDTGNDLRQIAPIVGFPNPEAMLRSDEFSDIVGCDYTEAALGSSSTRDEKTLCYRIVPNNRTKHLIDAIVQSKEEREIQHQYRQLSTKALLDNASANSKILEGKEKILSALGELTERGLTSDGYIDLMELQRKYQEIHGVVLDKEELRKYFPKTQMKKVIEQCMSDDIEIGTRPEQTGSMFFRLKRPLAEIMADHEKIRQHRPSQNKGHRQIQNMNNDEPGTSGIVPLKPKENAPVLPTVQKSNTLFTTDALLARKFGAIDDVLPESQKHLSFSFKYGQKPSEPQVGEIIPGLNSEGNLSVNEPITYNNTFPPKGDIVARGNVEEIQAILNSSKRNNFPRRPYQPNVLEKRNGWSSNLPPKKEFTNNNNTTYTTRGNGAFTDDENSSDDEGLFNYGNQKLRNEKKDFSLKPISKPDKTEELLAKAGVSMDKSNSAHAPDLHSTPITFETSTNNEWWSNTQNEERLPETRNNFVSRNVNGPQSSVHAEKYLRQAMENKNEGRARYMATKLAAQENNVSNNIFKPVARTAQGAIVPLKKSESDEDLSDRHNKGLTGGFGSTNRYRARTRSPPLSRPKFQQNSCKPTDYFSEVPSAKWEKPYEKHERFNGNFANDNSNFRIPTVTSNEQNGKPLPTSGGSFFSKFKIHGNGLGSTDREVAIVQSSTDNSNFRFPTVTSNEQNGKPRPTSGGSFFSNFKIHGNGVGSTDREVAELFKNDRVESNMDDDIESSILAVHINLIVMQRSSVTLTNLKETLEFIFQKPIKAGVTFQEKSWAEFIKRYCHNVSATDTVNDAILIWSPHNDSGMKAALGKFIRYSKGECQ